jgi:hypothetical protein
LLRSYSSIWNAFKLTYLDIFTLNWKYVIIYPLIMFFWVLAPCRLVDKRQRFREINSSIFRFEWRQIRDRHYPNRRENLK